MRRSAGTSDSSRLGEEVALLGGHQFFLLIFMFFWVVLGFWGVGEKDVHVVFFFGVWICFLLRLVGEKALNYIIIYGGLLGGREEAQVEVLVKTQEMLVNVLSPGEDLRPKKTTSLGR